MAHEPNASRTSDSDRSASADGARNDLREEARHLAGQAASTAKDVLETGRDYVEQIRDTGQEYTEKAYDAGKRKAEEAAFYTELGYEETIIQVRRHPLPALAIAAGVGFLLAYATARR